MALTHYPDVGLHPEDALGTKGTRVTLSREPNGKAILFVHGYGGSAINTWKRFDKMLLGERGFEGYDFFFYGYDGRYSTTEFSAGILCAFLDRLFRQPFSIIGPLVPITAAGRDLDGFRYQQVILAAHSLGAVICRRCLLSAHRKGHDWPSRTSMVLYAPAHKGARVSELLRMADGFLGYLVTSARYNSPLIDELAPDSDALKTLLAQTIETTSSGDARFLVAQKVAIAEREKIVVNLRFGNDPEPTPFPGSDHCSVCKPNDKFVAPLDLLKNAI